MAPFQLFLQQLANGLTIGAIYALIALGYTMVYGVIQLINFAHGEVFMVGAYLALTVLSALGVIHPMGELVLVALCGICMTVAITGCGLLGVGIERVAYRPLRPRAAESANQAGQAPRLAALITAIGVSFFLQNAIMLLYGATDRRVPPLIPSLRFEMGGMTVTGLQMMIWA
ncbi:MAG: branched-chain amino acid ABC transporter permease, partial [Candidatus Omnitrophica bacterium]|nr:branched-chain amino acid ABC transporter permease [Candidatus Omnitrophota bacterium]